MEIRGSEIRGSQFDERADRPPLYSREKERERTIVHKSRNHDFRLMLIGVYHDYHYYLSDLVVIESLPENKTYLVSVSNFRRI